MPTPVTMPQLGESVTEGTVTRWLKQVGEQVQADEPLLEVSTDKVDTEIPAPASGVLTAISVQEDEVAAVGAELAVIDEPGAAAAGAAAGSPAAPQQAETPAVPAAPAPAPAASAPAAPAPAAPAPAAPAPAAPAPTSGGEGTPVTLPALGESVTEGTVTRWLKQVGDAVTADEPLLEVSTDKVDTEIPAPASGVLLSIDVPEDSTVAVGSRLAVIGEPGAQAAAATPAAPAEAEPQPAPAAAAAAPAAPAAAAAAPAEPQPTGAASYPAPSEPATPPSPQPASPPATPPAATAGQPADGQQPSGESPYATPLVRRLAAEHGVDLASIRGTGVGGRIRKQDVLDAAGSRGASAPTPPAPTPSAPTGQAPAPAAAPPASAPPAPPASAPPAPPAPAPAPASSAPAPAAAGPASRGTRQPMSRLRKVIATRMVESLQTSAQLTTVVEADLTSIARLRDRAKAAFEQREGTRLSFLPFFAVATIEALKAHPQVNASLDGEDVVYHDGVNLGIAVDTERGLLVPVIRDAGDLNLGGIARKIADLAERTRSNRITPDELGGGTFTLTNTGSRGALFDTPIINQPQVGILGTGSVVKRAVVVQDELGADVIAVRSMAYVALTYDHRLVDGADAARFLVTVKERLEHGSFEAELGF